MKSRRKNKGKKILVGTLSGLVLAGLITVGAWKLEIYPFEHVQHAAQPAAIQPTIFVSGSGGSVNESELMIDNVKTLLHSKTSNSTLKIGVDISKNNKITVSGKLDKDDPNPMVAFGTVKGTIDGEKYSQAIKVAVEYLQTKYNISSINLEGFSSGGTGVMDYIEEYSKASYLPKVDKVAFLDPEFNTKKPLAEGQTLGDLLLNGPELSMQTPMYQNIVKKINGLDPKVEFAILESEFKAPVQSDGVIPYADALSTYHLMQNNGNFVVIHFYPSKTSHGGILASNLNAAKFMKEYFYQ
jgi:uncharacterized alpha/beta hydrolase family protein